MASQEYTIKNVHSVNLLKYGKSKNVKQLVVAQGRDGVKVMGDLDLEVAKAMIETEISTRLSYSKENWVLRNIETFPKLPMSIKKLLKQANMIKTFASKIMKKTKDGKIIVMNMMIEKVSQIKKIIGNPIQYSP